MALTTARTLVPALLGVALLAGCSPGGSGTSATRAAPSGGAPAPSASPSTSAGPGGPDLSPIPAPATIRPSRPPKTPTDVPPEITVEGTVFLTLECVLMNDRTGAVWNLEGEAARTLHTDQWVAATGQQSPTATGPCPGSTLVIRKVTTLAHPPR